MKIKMKRLFGILLSLALVLGLMPGMSLTALAEDPYAALKNTTTPVKFDEKDWYLINYDSNTVTLLSKACVGASVFGSNNTYSGSTVEGSVNDWYSNRISPNAKTAVYGNGAFLLSTGDVSNLSQDVLKCDPHPEAAGNYWWLCTPGSGPVFAKSVDGSNGQVSDLGSSVSYALLGVRPAIKLNRSSVFFESQSNEFTVIKVDVTGVTLNKTAVTLNANGTETLTATVAPDNATDTTITWSSDNESVATVSDGVVNAVAAGTATITVTATNGTDVTSDDKEATCTVTVNAASSGGDSSDSGSGDSSGNSSSNDSNNDSSNNNNSSNDSGNSNSEPKDETPYDYLDPLRGELKAEIALGGERTVTWNQGTALPYDIMKTLQDNPGVTLIFSYTYQGIDYKVTISGRDAKAYTEIPWYGPLYLYEHYGSSSETAPADTADTAIGTRTYTVIPGDTLSEIATKLNTTVESLVSLNDIKNRDFILVGQILKY